MLPFLFFALACAPKQQAELRIEIHREGLTAIELELLTSEEQRISRCRIYPAGTANVSDGCVFEDGVDSWSGETRTADDALSLLVYGDIDTNSITAVVTGFVDGRAVVTDRVDGIVFAAEQTASTRFILPSVTETVETCRVEFSSIAGMTNFQKGPALNLVSSNTGSDLLFAGLGQLNRYRYTKASGNSSNCVVTNVDSKTLPGLCNVRADHLVVGPMSVMQNEIGEYAALVCSPSDNAPGASAGPRLHFAEYELDASDSRQLISINLGPSARLDGLSPLTMGNPTSLSPEGPFEVLAHYAATSSSAAPRLSAIRLSTSRNSPIEQIHEFESVRPAIQCVEGSPCTDRVPPLCRQGRLPVLSQGCIECRARNSFMNPDLECTGQNELLFLKDPNGNTLECLPKNECAFEQNFGNQLSNIVAPYPPLMGRIDGNGTDIAMLTLGYPGGAGFRRAGTSRTDERPTSSKTSVFQPVLLDEEEKDSFALQDLALSATRNLRLNLVNLGDAQAQLSRPTRIFSLLQDLNYPKAYAIGKTANEPSAFAAFGEFYLRRATGTSDFETVLTVHVRDLDPARFESTEGSRTATISFSNSPLTNGVHGIATVLLGNIDADPTDTELIIFQPEFGQQIHAFKFNDSTLEPLAGFPIVLDWRSNLDEPRRLSVVLADLDKNGSIEVIAADKSQLQIFSLGIDSYDKSNLAWPMERRDRQNSSRFSSAQDPN